MLFNPSPGSLSELLILMGGGPNHLFTRLRLVVCARVCTDLYDKKFGSSLQSYVLKFQISLRSERSLRRYLQNNTDFNQADKARTGGFAPRQE